MLYKQLYEESSAMSDDTRYFQISRLISSAIHTFWLSMYRLLSKLWHVKRRLGYLFCTENNVIHIIISSIICHVRWYQILSYTHLISSVSCTLSYLSYPWHIKRVAGVLFCTERNVIHNKRHVDNQKVQVADEIKRDNRKYLGFSVVADDAWYNYVYKVSSCAK